MARKQVETIDRYRIYAETSIEKMGFVLAALTKAGCENIGHELITDVLNYKGKRVFETSAADAITEWIKENPTFAIGDAVKHFKAEGRTSGSIYTAVATLVESGVLKKLGGKNYSAANVKHLDGPKEEERTRPAFTITGTEAVWRFIKNRKSFNTKQLRTLFRGQRRKENSVSPILNGLLIEKKIKHIGSHASGQYIVLKVRRRRNLRQ